MPWSRVFGGATAERVRQGLPGASRHVGGAPARIVSDNAAGVGRGAADEARGPGPFRRFRPRHGFEASFRDPDAGRERGHVGREAAFARSNVFVPVPGAGGPREHSERLPSVADGFAGGRHRRRPGTWGEPLEDGRAALGDPPPGPLPCATWLARPCDERGEVTVGARSCGASPGLALGGAAVGLGAPGVTVVDRATGEAVAGFPRRLGSGATRGPGPAPQPGPLARRPGARREPPTRGGLPAEASAWPDGLGAAGRRGRPRQLGVVAGRSGSGVAAEPSRGLAGRGGGFGTADAGAPSPRVAGGTSEPGPGPDLAAYGRVPMGREAMWQWRAAGRARGSGPAGGPRRPPATPWGT